MIYILTYYYLTSAYELFFTTHFSIFTSYLHENPINMKFYCFLKTLSYLYSFFSIYSNEYNEF